MAYEEDDSKRKRRYALISISSVLLISMVVAVTIGVNVNKNENEGGDGEITASVKAIKDVCAPTDYKKTCEDTLKKDAHNSSDPLELIKTAFNATMKQISHVAKKSQTMIELQKDPRSKMALDQCKELMDYAIGELNKSFEEIGKIEAHEADDALVKLKIWLSATISHEQTCLDGFQGAQGNAGETIQKALKTAIQLTHNGLAMITEMSNYLNQMQFPELVNNRRLLSEEFPLWVDGRARRLLTAPMSEVKPDITVAQDGSGQYKTINEALEKVPKKQNETFLVYIKEGTYKEYVQVNRSMMHLVFIGDGPDKTIISGDKGFTDGITTYRTASVSIIGDNFIAKNMAFENTAGAIKHQAVAIRVLSDESIFYNCRFDGYQDTLYAHSHRQFYRDCTISGTIDFLFGDAAAVFQNCTLLVRKPLPNQACPITAHGREDPREPTGFVLQGCTIVGDPEYLAVKASSKAYLGRPWKEYSRTIIMNTFIPDFIPPAGWMVWLGEFGLKTLFYSEVENTGPGAPTANRVTWEGIKKLTAEEILQFTPNAFIQGDTWIPGKGVPYVSGLYSGNSSGADAATAISPSASTTGPVNSTAGSNSTGSGSSSNTTEAGNATAAAPLAATSNTIGGLESASPSAAPLPSPSGSDEASPSASNSTSASASPSASPSASTSASPSASASDSTSPSPSASASDSTSSTASPAASTTSAASPSASTTSATSPSASTSSSPSASASVSPSASP